MANRSGDTEMETIGQDGRANGRPGAVSLRSREATDSRIVADTSGYTSRSASRHADISPTGEQFILSSWANLLAGLWLLVAPFVLTFADHAHRARANDLTLGIIV